MFHPDLEWLIRDRAAIPVRSLSGTGPTIGKMGERIDAIPKVQHLPGAELEVNSLRLSKFAAHIIETKSRIRIAFATAWPEAELICGLVVALQRFGP